MVQVANPIFPTSPTPTKQSFTQKLLEVDITLGPNPQTNQPNQFGNGSNTVTLSGSRISARVQAVGTLGTTAQVDVWGLTPSLLNELSTLGLAFSLVPQNTLSIRAGDAVSGLSTIFVGTVMSATGDYNQAPNVPMHFECFTDGLNSVIPLPASSFPQATDVGTIMSGLASQMHLGFENNGVNVKLPPSYFVGSGVDQYRAVAAHANIEAAVVQGSLGNQVLAIWPRGKSRKSLPTVMLSPTTGLIGYPSYTAYGILVKAIFNPQIGFGGMINVKSSLPKATGQWIILRLDHALDSVVPKGLWESSMWCYNPNYPIPSAPTS
jgi:hypothetical protein